MGCSITRSVLRSTLFCEIRRPMYSFGEFLAHPRRFDAQPRYYYSSHPRQTAIADRVLFGTAWVNSGDGADQLTAAPRNVDGSRTPRLQWIIGALLDGRSRAREGTLTPCLDGTSRHRDTFCAWQAVLLGYEDR